MVLNKDHETKYYLITFFPFNNCFMPWEMEFYFYCLDYMHRFDSWSALIMDTKLFQLRVKKHPTPLQKHSSTDTIAFIKFSYYYTNIEYNPCIAQVIE